MTRTAVITEEMIEEALARLQKRIAEPPPSSVRSYTRKDAFLKIRDFAKEALAAGHSLETVLDDLKGVGIGLSLSTARQYLKPGRKQKKQASSVTVKPSTKANHAALVSHPEIVPEQSLGTFTVTEDRSDI